MIRPARDADAEALSALNREFNGSELGWEWPPDRLRANCEVVLVAEQDGRAVGFACLQVLHSACYPKPCAELTELYVTPSSRGRGVGAALLREAEKHARDSSASELSLRTNARNQPAQRLFVRAGLEAAEDVVFCKAL